MGSIILTVFCYAYLNLGTKPIERKDEVLEVRDKAIYYSYTVLKSHFETTVPFSQITALNVDDSGLVVTYDSGHMFIPSYFQRMQELVETVSAKTNLTPSKISESEEVI